MTVAPVVDVRWLAERLGDPAVVVLEVDELPLLYRVGHIAGAHPVDRRADLRNPTTRGIPDPAAVRALWARLGIGESSHVVLYGDVDNWWACFAFWVFRLHGLGRMSILDGGRAAWLRAGLPMVTQAAPGERSAPAGPPPQPRPVRGLRASWSQVLRAGAAGAQLLDVRTRAEYVGAQLTEPGFEHEAPQRGGHIPGALNVPWETTTGSDARFLALDDLRARLQAAGTSLAAPLITYCRIGERSAHTWFVLHELLGCADVRAYDGSWAEWANVVGLPAQTGPQRGELTAVEQTLAEVTG